MLSRRSFDRPSTVQRRWAGARAKERACACACACVYAVGVPSQLVAAITHAVDQTGKLINECDAHSEMPKFCRRGEHHSHLEKILHLRAVVGLGDHAHKLHVPHRRGHLQVRPPAPQLSPGSTKPGVRLARRLHHLRARACPAAHRRSASACARTHTQRIERIRPRHLLSFDRHDSGGSRPIPRRARRRTSARVFRRPAACHARARES